MFNYTTLDESRVEFVEIAPAAEVPNGERIFVEVSERPIVIFNIAGQLFAIGDVCTHDNGPLAEGELSGFQIICPRHGARFDVTNGKVLSLPAVEDIPAYPLRVNNGEIEIGLPAEQ